jgi:hypothetical protein
MLVKLSLASELHSKYCMTCCNSVCCFCAAAAELIQQVALAHQTFAGLLREAVDKSRVMTDDLVTSRQVVNTL